MLGMVCHVQAGTEEDGQGNALLEERGDSDGESTAVFMKQRMLLVLENLHTVDFCHSR
jgi:hypothetical protein